MRTTIYIEDELYKNLVNESIRMFGNAKNISAVANMFIKQALKKEKSEKRENFFAMFGSKKFDFSGIRDEHDRAF